MDSFSQGLNHQRPIVFSWISLQLFVFLFSIVTTKFYTGCGKRAVWRRQQQQQGSSRTSTKTSDKSLEEPALLGGNAGLKFTSDPLKDDDLKTATEINDQSMKEPTQLCSCSNPSSMTMSRSVPNEVRTATEINDQSTRDATSMCSSNPPSSLSLVQKNGSCKDGKCYCASAVNSILNCICSFGSNLSVTGNDKFDFQPNRNPRKALPFDQIYGGGISLWDIAKRQLPIHAFEPLSILQAACEELRYAGRFLNKYNEIKAADERMLLVVGFIISGYSCLIGRNRKPFNPLLGETFDFIHSDGWKYHAEQVSHHPLVSACYASGPEQKWQWFQTIHPKLMPSLDSITVQPLLPTRLKFSNDDEYSWNKVAVTIQNVRAEADKRRVINEGKMLVTSNTGLEAEINFMADEKNTLEGKVRQNGKVLHKLVGAWDTGIFRLKENNEKVALFVTEDQGSRPSRQYGFNSFTVQLNELQSKQREQLPPTDSRFRPDIRALENLEVKKAEMAKKDLEQAQRLREAQLTPHVPMWFTKEQDFWVSNNSYWKEKSTGFKNPKQIKLFSIDTLTE